MTDRPDKKNTGGEKLPGSGATSTTSRWSMLLVDDAPWLPVVLIAGTVLTGSAWLLASPSHVVSRLMTWDLLYNLSGAWHLQAGQVAHVDFHDPLGSLSFWLTAAGFWICGPTVSAFIVGELVIAATLFVAATVASVRRLPLVPAVLFVLFACQLVLIPTNVGDLIDDFTFAMSYNAYGWAALIVLSLILFVPPRSQIGFAWVDVAVASALLVILYYLKVVYFVVALAELAAAFLISNHIRAHRLAWGAASVVVIANAIAPHNWAYIGDISATIASGGVRTGWRALVILLSANVPELSLYAIVFLITVALWRSGQAPPQLPAAVGVLTLGGLAILTQNAQLRGLPLCGVAFFLLYHQIRENPAWRARGGTIWVLLASLAFPAASVGAGTLSLAAYFRAATNGAPLFVVDHTNLRGLAVPAKPRDTVAHHATGYTWLSRARSIGGNVRLSQFEYVQSILEAASLFDQSAGRPGGILLLDQVNPLPFVLGRVPPRGGNLWMDTGFPWQTEEAMFADADYVLIPKLSTYIELTEEAILRYGPYLAKHFPVRTDSPSWVLLGRRARPS